MKDDDRIIRIQKAISDEQLDDAMAGCSRQAITEHPALRNNLAFKTSMDAGQFLRALEQVRRARQADGDEYRDVIRVLEFAATRRLAIMMLQA